MLYAQISRIDFCMSVTRTEAVILDWECPELGVRPRNKTLVREGEKSTYEN